MANDLLDLWAQASANEPDEHGCVLRVGFPNTTVALNARIELYRLRTKARRQSKKSLSPEDPGYDTSPWDGFRIVMPGADRNGKGGKAELHFFVLGHGRFDFVILPPEVLDVAKPIKPKPKKK